MLLRGLFSDLDPIDAAKHPSFHLVDLTAERTRHHPPVHDYVHSICLLLILIDELVLDMLHEVVLTIKNKRIRLSFVFKLFLESLFPPFGLNYAFPVDDALSRSHHRQALFDTFLLKFALFFSLLYSKLTLLLSRDQFV